ncbi:holliday junction resolvasE [Bacteriophage sp.]|nr:holliday junction resolvasE [Bacteriophage sp.]
MLFPMPTMGEEIDGHGIAGVLEGIRDAQVIIGIEKVGAMPGQGVTSMFSFGFGCGMLEGVIQTLGLPYVKITPQTWQKLAFQGVTPIYKTERGKDKPDTKKMALTAVNRLYPSANLLATERSKVPHKGIIDALLIAHYLKVNNR